MIPESLGTMAAFIEVNTAMMDVGIAEAEGKMASLAENVASNGTLQAQIDLNVEEAMAEGRAWLAEHEAMQQAIMETGITGEEAFRILSEGEGMALTEAQLLTGAIQEEAATLSLYGATADSTFASFDVGASTAVGGMLAVEQQTQSATVAMNHLNTSSGGLKATLNQIKGMAGKGSSAGMIMGIMRGAGPLLAVGMGLKFLSAASEKASELAQKLKDGEISSKQMADNIVDSLPIFSSLVKIGADIANAFSPVGSPESIISKAEASAKQYAKEQQRNKENMQAAEGFGTEAQRLKDTAALIGLEGERLALAQADAEAYQKQADIMKQLEEMQKKHSQNKELFAGGTVHAQAMEAIDSAEKLRMAKRAEIEKQEAMKLVDLKAQIRAGELQAMGMDGEAQIELLRREYDKKYMVASQAEKELLAVLQTQQEDEIRKGVREQAEAKMRDLDYRMAEIGIRNIKNESERRKAEIKLRYQQEMEAHKDNEEEMKKLQKMRQMELEQVDSGVFDTKRSTSSLIEEGSAEAYSLVVKQGDENGKKLEKNTKDSASSLRKIEGHLKKQGKPKVISLGWR